MGSIVAIGGGEITDRETEPIDRHVCDLAVGNAPAALFVPTASGDADGYRDAFEAYYGDHLGCRTRHLTLHDGTVPDARIRDDLDWADLVYVGGGSLRLLLDCWREYGIGPRLRAAYRDGTVVAGLSAGATCWFAGGVTDGGERGEFASVECLGWIDDVAFTPHAHPLRRAAFREYVSTGPEVGLAVEDCCAVELTDGEYRVVSATGDEAAYRYTNDGGRVRVTKLDEGDGFEDLPTSVG